MSDDLKFISCNAADLSQYRRVKRVLDRAQHPEHLGPARYTRCLERGGDVLLFSCGDEDVATMWMDPHPEHTGEFVGYVLSVIKAWQARGIARRVLTEHGPKYGRVTDPLLGFFADCGYQISGPPDWSQRRYVTYPVSREPAEWLAATTAEGKTAADALAVSRDAHATKSAEADARREARGAHVDAAQPFDPPPELLAAASFSSLVGASQRARKIAQLKLLDEMLLAAIRDGKLADALKIQGEAARLLRTL